MQTRFQFTDFAKSFALSIVFFAIVLIVLSFLPGVGESMRELHPSAAFAFQYLVQFIVLYFPLWFFVIEPYQAGPRAFGMRKISPFRVIKWASFAYLAYLGFSLGLGLLLQASEVTVPGYEAQEAYLPFFGTDPFGIVIAFITIVIIAPVLEEFYFRGFVYQIFTKTWPVWLGSFLTAFLFAFVHMQFMSVIPLFILGLILNHLMQRTESLWVPIAFHALNNLIAFSVELYLYFNPELTEQMASHLLQFYV